MVGKYVDYAEAGEYVGLLLRGTHREFLEQGAIAVKVSELDHWKSIQD